MTCHVRSDLRFPRASTRKNPFRGQKTSAGNGDLPQTGVMQGEKDLYILLHLICPALYIDPFRSPIVLLCDLRWIMRIVRFSFYRKSIYRSSIGLLCGGVVYGCVVVFRTLFAMVSAHRAETCFVGSGALLPRTDRGALLKQPEKRKSFSF